MPRPRSKYPRFKVRVLGDRSHAEVAWAISWAKTKIAYLHRTMLYQISKNAKRVRDSRHFHFSTNFKGVEYIDMLYDAFEGLWKVTIKAAAVNNAIVYSVEEIASDNGLARLPLFFDAVTGGNSPIASFSLSNSGVGNINAVNTTAIANRFDFDSNPELIPYDRSALGERLIDKGIKEGFNNLDFNGAKAFIMNAPAEWIALGAYEFLTVQVTPFYVDVEFNKITLIVSAFISPTDAEEYGIGLLDPVDNSVGAGRKWDALVANVITMPLDAWYRNAIPQVVENRSSVNAGTALTIDFGPITNIDVGAVPNSEGVFSVITQTDSVIPGGILRTDSVISGTVVNGVASSVTIESTISMQLGTGNFTHDGIDFTDIVFEATDLRPFLNGGGFTSNKLRLQPIGASNIRWKEWLSLGIVTQFQVQQFLINVGLGGYRYPLAAVEHPYFGTSAGPEPPFSQQSTEIAGGAPQLSATTMLRVNPFQYAWFRCFIRTEHIGNARCCPISEGNPALTIFHRYAITTEDGISVRIRFVNGVPVVENVPFEAPQTHTFEQKQEFPFETSYTYPAVTLSTPTAHPVRREPVPYVLRDSAVNFIEKEQVNFISFPFPLEDRQGVHDLYVNAKTRELNTVVNPATTVADSTTELVYVQGYAQSGDIALSNAIRVYDKTGETLIQDADAAFSNVVLAPMVDNPFFGVANERTELETERWDSFPTGFSIKTRSSSTMSFPSELYDPFYLLQGIGISITIAQASVETTLNTLDLPLAGGSGTFGSGSRTHSVFWPDAGGDGIHGVLIAGYKSTYDAAVNAYRTAFVANPNDPALPALKQAALDEVLVIYNNFASDDFILAINRAIPLVFSVGQHYVVLQ